MSGIAGILNFDGRPVDPVVLSRMIDTIADRGPDSADSWISGPIGMGQRMLRTTPESATEVQPLRDEEADLCITMDGRLDNREELQIALGLTRRLVETLTDAGLVLCAYRQWDSECIRRLIGDFALAIWDGRNRQLVCARDFMGKRPFYYHLGPRVLRWGSELQQILLDPGISGDPDEGMLAEYLAAQVVSAEDTVFRSVKRLPAAHVLIARDGRVRIIRYWDSEPPSSLRYRHDDEYASHFLELLSRVGRAHLRAAGPVGVRLSGGIDSSLVVGLAASLSPQASAPTPGLQTYSLTFPGRDCDETNYIDDVVRMWNVPNHRVSPEPFGSAHYEDEIRRYRDLPDYPNGSMHHDLTVLAARNGCRVMLTGAGGDHWFQGSMYHYADLLLRLRLISLAREARYDSRTRNSITPAAIRPLLMFGLKPLIPVWSVRALRTVRRPRPGPAWLSREFSDRVHLYDRLRDAPRAGPAHYARSDHAAALGSGWLAHENEIRERSSSRLGIEERDPFHDRRIVEFALAIPEAQRRRGKYTKYVMRQAGRRLLPETVRHRTTKAHFSHVFDEELRLQAPAVLADLLLERFGWVDGHRVRDTYLAMDGEYAGAASNPRNYWECWALLAIERWARLALGG